MASDIESIIQSSISQGAMPLFYDDSFEKSLGLVRAMYQSGMQVIEYINRGPAAFENFRRLKLETQAEMPGLILGAGTIRTTEDAHKFTGIGADFLVSPCFDPWIASFAADLKVLYIPGCMTPTEIHIAWKQGIRLIKIFPAGTLGPSFIKAVKEVYPELIFMASGGVKVEKENLQKWFDSGTSLVALGTDLITKAIKESSDFSLLGQNSLLALKLIREVRA